MTHRLVLSHHAHASVHGSGVIGRFNAWLAVRVTRYVGTVWCAYLFVLITLVSLPQAFAAFMAGDHVTGISWVAQTFFQLVLLPIILVGQNVISATQDARAETDHETLTLLHEINVQQLEILKTLAEVKPVSVDDVRAALIQRQKFVGLS